MQRIVITGAPGAGKTTLIEELAARGLATVAESARAIIAGRLAQGLPPRPEPLAFARQILHSDLEKYSLTPLTGGPVFHDRSAVEAIGMIHEASPLTDEDLQARLRACRYHRTVFILPPWPAIFVNDAERDQSFSHAVAVHERLERWYERCGYVLHTVARLPVGQRADHILRALKDGA